MNGASIRPALWLFGIQLLACQPKPLPPSPASSPGAPQATQDVAPSRPALAAIACSNPTLLHATLYTEPQKPPLQDANVEIVDGRIAAVGSADSEGSECRLDVEGRVVVAGFWNTHVHFTNPEFADLETAAPLLSAMLLSYGFTSVVDTGADPRVVHSLRDAIRDGRIDGPHIVVAGGSFVYREGTPSYLPKGLLPELAIPEQAAPAVNGVLDAGADGIKIFSGSFQTPSHTIYLPPAIIAAVSESAHARGGFVVSHPTDRQGLVNAVENGVDVLAHTAPPAGKLGAALVALMLERGVALTPTLKLWRWELSRHGVPEQGIEHYVSSGVQQLREFHAAGGDVLFGTDVGYMQDFDPREEFLLMERAGLTFDDILAALTANPARRFSETGGTVAVGEPADLVVLDADPRADVGALADVAMTLRGGRIVFRRER